MLPFIPFTFQQDGQTAIRMISGIGGDMDKLRYINCLST